ncbi:MAG: hypothetical protein NZ942_02860 [Candidatus Aenigmarchaeota archaeon]|nr:hypothetical protein [Candidatus Aenigmarchaeota archaeon]
MAKCPKCGSKNTTYDEINEVWLCNNPACGIGFRGKAPISAKLKKSFLGLFKKKETKKEGEEEEGKKKERKSSIFPALLLLVALIITFLVPLDHTTKTFIVIGIGIFVMVVYGFFNFASFGFLILIIYLVFNLPVVHAEFERIGVYEGFETFRQDFCINTCILRNIFYTRGDPRAYCESQCGVVRITKIPGACTECLTYEKYERIYPAREGSSEIVDINLKMAKSNTIAKNVWVDVFREKDVNLKADVNKCSYSETCELRGEEEKRVIATFSEDYVKCEGSVFKYRIKVGYDFETKSDNSFDLVKEFAGTITEVKSPSSEGPLSVSIGGQKYYVIGEDDYVYVSIYVSNSGKGVVKINEIKVYQIPPYGQEELSFTYDCIKGYIFSKSDYQYSERILTISGTIHPLGKNEKDAIICKFALPYDIPSSKLTYSFKAEVKYSYELENSYSIACIKTES